MSNPGLFLQKAIQSSFSKDEILQSSLKNRKKILKEREAAIRAKKEQARLVRAQKEKANASRMKKLSQEISRIRRLKAESDGCLSTQRSASQKQLPAVKSVSSLNGSARSGVSTARSTSSSRPASTAMSTSRSRLSQTAPNLVAQPSMGDLYPDQNPLMRNHPSLISGRRKRRSLVQRIKGPANEWAKIFEFERAQFILERRKQREAELEAQAKWREELKDQVINRQATRIETKDKDKIWAVLIEKDVKKWKEEEALEKQKSMESYIRETEYCAKQAEQVKARRERRRLKKIREERKVMEAAKRGIEEEKREMLAEKERQRLLMEEMKKENAVLLERKKKIKESEWEQEEKLNKEWETILDRQDKERRAAFEKIYKQQAKNVSSEMNRRNDMWEQLQKDEERAAEYQRQYQEKKDREQEERERKRLLAIEEQRKMLDRQMEIEKRRRAEERELNMKQHHIYVGEDMKALKAQRKAAEEARLRNIAHAKELRKEIALRQREKKKIGPGSMTEMEYTMNKQRLEKAMGFLNSGILVEEGRKAKNLKQISGSAKGILQQCVDSDSDSD